MNDTNKRLNIQEEVTRAAEALRAADLLYENGFVKDAVSKLYYVLLYNIRALLLTEGLEPKSHEGVLRLFGFYFVKTGIFDVKDSHLFSRLMKYREEADYNPSYTFLNEDFKELRNELEDAVRKITAYLKQKGYA
ncbi:MAG: HEPN domain-containing protein [Desulfobacterota bacterium]|nr:HEPN domain-containing protein [Thermodesulfobacteriota bacterium]